MLTGRLRKVQRSFVPVGAANADPMTARPGHEQVLTTHTRNLNAGTQRPKADLAGYDRAYLHGFVASLSPPMREKILTD